MTLEGTFGGKTYYVSKSGTDGDALSWSTAKRTIQAAVDVCGPGDTVIVDDGEYSDTTDWSYTDREGEAHVLPTVVQIRKRIHLKARNTRKASIVGAWGAENGVGEGARRCIFVEKQPGSLIEGFVIRNGSTPGAEAENTDFDTAGGVMAEAETYLVDCDFLDCRAGTGAAVGRAGVPIRCYFRGNVGVANEGEVGHVFYRCNYAYDCIFERNGSMDEQFRPKGSICQRVMPMTLVNCTLLNNLSAYAFDPYGTNAMGNVALNCAFLSCQILGNGSRKFELIQKPADYALSISNCVESTWQSDSSAICQFGDPENYTQVKVGASKADVSDKQYLAPALDDWRMTVGSDLLDAGDMAYTQLDWIPVEYQNTDFFGNPRQVGANVDIGAIENQGELETPETGYYELSEGIRITVGTESFTPVEGRWLCFADFPGQVRLAPNLAAGQPFFGFKFTRGWTLMRFPDLGADGGVWFTPGKDNWTVSAVPATAQLWVDKSYAAGDSDGSAERPYAKIQDALDHCVDFSVIRVRSGDYDTGESTLDGHVWPARVAVSKNVAIRAVDGPEETVIRGDSATRCVAVKGNNMYVQIQGFTLTDGHTLGEGSSSDSIEGGAFWAPYARGDGKSALPLDSIWAQLTDCVVSNNIAWHAGAMVGGWAQRCHFAANREQKEGNRNTTRGSAVYATYASACTFTDNWCEYEAPLAAIAYSMLYNTTHFKEPRKVQGTDTAFRAFEQFTAAFNSTVADCLLDSVNTNRAGVLSCGNIGSGSNGDYLTLYPTNELFAAAEQGDYRLRSDAEGLRKGNGTATRHTYFAVGDFNGNALTYIDGSPIPGAFARPAPVVRISSAAALRGSVDPMEAVVDEGSSITFANAEGTAGHRLIGWFDGTSTNQQTSVSFTYSVPEGIYTSAIEAGPVFSSDIYVNAQASDDSGDGITPETAMKRLSTAGAVAVAGDTIHAADGDYNEGSMTATQTISVDPNAWGHSPSRIVLRTGVSLVSENGPEKTFITGNVGTNVNCLGLQAIRGVTAYENTLVRGFTIRNGATFPMTSKEYDSGIGGGILAPKAGNADGTAFVDNCIISNNYARTGGNVWGGILNKCIIRDGLGNAGSTIARYAQLRQCACSASRNTTVGYHYGIYSSTIRGENGGTNYELNAADQDSPIENSVLLVACSDLSKTMEPCRLANFRNCIWYDAAKTYTSGDYQGQRYYQPDPETFVNVTVISDRAEAGLDERLCPKRDSIAVDAGDMALLAGLPDAETDVVGTPRVLNDGKVDIGAYEYDWRVDYAAALGKGICVTSCDPTVSLVDGAVCLPANAEIVVTNPNWRANERVDLSVASVQGTLNAYRGGDETSCLSVTENGTYKLKLGADTRLRFSAEGGSAYLSELRRRAGLMVVVR